VHVPVHFRNNTGQSATAVRNGGNHDRGSGHDGAMHIGHVLPLSNHIRYYVCVVRDQFPNAVHGAGTADVAQGQGPGHRGGRSGQVAGLGPPDTLVHHRGGSIG